MEMPTPQLAAERSPYASFWNRVGAALIDGIILVAAAWLVSQVAATQSVGFAYGSFFYTDLQGQVHELSSVWVVGFGVFCLLYKAILESSDTGATFGKRVMKLEVTDMSGARLGFMRAAARSWPIWAPWALPLPYANWLVWILALSACVAVARSDRKQGWHDRMTRALVVYRDTRFTADPAAM